MRIKTMLRALPEAKEEASFIEFYNLDGKKTPLMLIEQGDRIANGIARRYTALQAENARLQAENAKLVSLGDAIAELLEVMPSPEYVARLQAENARLRDELAAKDTDNA